jgi:hypothetical protein
MEGDKKLVRIADKFLRDSGSVEKTDLEICFLDKMINFEISVKIPKYDH